MKSSVRRNPARRAGFTIVEMLVVVLIVGILSAIVFGLIKVAGVWSAKAQTNERLGKIRAAIEEFKAEYGKYPPVPYYGGIQPFGYEFPCTNGMKPAAYAVFDVTTGSTKWDEGTLFTFGLMSFLVSRYDGRAGYIAESDWSKLLNLHQWTDYNKERTGDQSRDMAATRRWMPYIGDLLTLPEATTYRGRTISGAPYTNLYLTVYDGWDREFHYQSPPPYQSYRLWSDGPSASTTSDDISTGAGY